MKFILLEAPLKIIFMGATIDIYGYLQLYVVWKVTPGGSTTTTYDVTLLHSLGEWQEEDSMESLSQPWELLILSFSMLMFQSQLELLFQLTDRIASEENTEQTQSIFKLTYVHY